MTLPTLSANQVAEKMSQGAILMDIRSLDEYRRKHIDGAMCLPPDELKNQPFMDGSVVIFHCLSGMRTRQNAPLLGSCAKNCEAYLLDGGLNAWEKAGLPVETASKGASLDIMRQVQLIAGMLIVLGVWGYVGVIFVITAFINFCPIYRIFNFSTKK